MDELARISDWDNFPCSNPNPVLCCDVHGAVVFFNPAASALSIELGCRSVRHILPEEHVMRVRRCLADDRSNTAESKIRGRTFTWIYRRSRQQNRVNLYGHEITAYLAERIDRLQPALLQAALNKLGLPLIGVDHGLTLLFCNQAAHAFIDKAHCASLSGGRLLVSYPGAEKRLKSEIARGAVSGSVLRLLFQDDEPEIEFVLLPLSASERCGEEPAAIIYLHRKNAGHHPAVRRVLKARYGLTDAEAGLAVCLVNGATLGESADALGIKISTARTQLHHIFKKTGARRQTEFVIKVLTGVLWLADCMEG